MTILVRPETPADRSGVRRVVGAAFRDEPVVPDLVDLLHQSGHARVGLVAVDDEDIVGHVLLSRSWVDAPEELVEVLVLSPLSVRPDRQGEGIGTELIRSALAEAERAGAPAVFLEGDPGYYRDRGFDPASGHGFDRPSRRIPDAACQVALLSAYRPAIAGRLVYCDPFWQLDCVGLRGAALEEVRTKLEGAGGASLATGITANLPVTD